MDEAQKIAELEDEVERLRAELAHQAETDEKLSRRRAKLSNFITAYAIRMLLSRRLAKSIEQWLVAQKRGDPLPLAETAEVSAALLLRVIRVGLVGLLLAILPVALLTWQSVLMRQGNTDIHRQFKQDRSDNLFDQRLHSLELIYRCTEEPSPDDPLEKICRPTAPLRLRQEAVLKFVEIERKNESPRANLVGAKLYSADLNHANFVNTVLLGANLRHANLMGANLTNADLRLSMLHRADLSGANLTNADLSDAKLRHANLRKATFTTANLSNADLSDADLRDAHTLEQKQVDAAIGDGGTQLPNHLNRPTHWN